MMKVEDFTAEMKAGWGPETEMGQPVRLSLSVKLSYNEDFKGYCLSIIGDLNIKESARLGLHAIHIGWQCTDIEEVLERNGLRCIGLDVIVPIWRKWSGNDMRPGSEAQEKCLEEFQENCPEWKYNYDGACILLKQRDLYEDKGCIVNGKPYRYGTGWMFRRIPNQVLADLCGALDSGLIIVPKAAEILYKENKS